MCAVASWVTASASLATASTSAAKPNVPHSSADAHEAARLAAMKLLAPADEYFGPLKMSILGIGNTLRDIGLRYDVNHDIARQSLASANLAESSIRDWARKYPRDGDVPHAIYTLQRLYTKILTVEGRAKAAATAKWLFTAYPNSPQARTLKRALAAETLPPLTGATSAPAATTQTNGTYTSVFGPAYPSRLNGTPSPEQTPAAGSQPPVTSQHP